ncbi:hypothetical protein MKW94_002029 [Papaver nudicaule]|uniref:Uncharacterized protein n=1 Tax=Papaver nudicaule TaxID=74823 RepID=A0AA42AV76_PAPNU|nr:hypothetical protein [Papaver nudicaule]
MIITSQPYVLEQDEEGYVSSASTVSCDYSEEASSVSPGPSDVETDEGFPCQVDGKYVGTLERFLSSKPTEDSWKMPWPKQFSAAESVCVNVYSYFKKESGCGGYALLLRNMSAQPLAASAKFSPDGKSYLYHLASKHGFSSPYVRCNSRIAVMLLSQIASRCCHCEGDKIGDICHRCASSIVPGMTEHSFKILVPLIEELQGKKLDSSKEAKKKAMLDKKTNSGVDYKADMEPSEFSDELVSFLLNDAYDSLYYNWDAWSRINPIN